MIGDRLICISKDNVSKNAANDLMYIFENEKYTEESGEKFLEFDVSIQANNTLTYLDNAVIVLTYNPTSFGSGDNVLNGDITISRGDAVLSIADYADPFVEDLPDLSGKKYFRVIISTNQSTSFPVRTQVGTSPISLCHVKMKIPDCPSATTSDILFEDHSGNSLWENRAFYTPNANDANNTNFQLYDNLDFSDASMQFPMCQVLIDNYTAFVPAGVDAHFIIEGRFFGSTPPIFNSDDAIIIDYTWHFDPFEEVINSFINLDIYDLSNAVWTENYIDIILPSSICDFQQRTTSIPFEVFYKTEMLHSGRFQITNTLGMVSEWSDANYLNVPYSTWMEIDCDGSTGSVNSKKRVKIVAEDTGYRDLYVSTEVFQNCELMGYINQAIKDWKCATGIDWRIADVVDQLERVFGDGISTITYDDQATGSAYARGVGADCGIYHDYDDLDIGINPMINETRPNGEIYTVMLHEFGHAAGLAHTEKGIGETRVDLMRNGVTAPVHDIFEIIDDDLAGAIEVFQFSSTSTCNPAFIPNQTGDYAMRDDLEDIGYEPNYGTVGGEISCVFKNIYLSPDLWNCDHISFDCGTNHEMPTEGELNTVKARINNLSDACTAEDGYLDFYWTIASTGEVWDSDWINSNQGGCLVGDIITSSPISVGALSPNAEIIVEHNWTPPTIDNLVSCGIEMNEDQGKFMLCLLARIHSDKDPIIIEEIGTGIGYSVHNNNNIVTKNTFILEVPQVADPEPCGSSVSILVANNNAFATNLNINLNGISGVGLNENFGVEITANEELWNRWSSTGQSSEGLEVVDERTVRVTDSQHASMMNIPLDANQREVISIQACDLLAPRSDGDTGVSFMITHEATNPDIEIASSSACIFKVVEKQYEPDIIDEQEVSISPNPTDNYLTLHMELMDESRVSAFIYTIQGQQVRTLIDDTIIGSGVHNITHNISDLADGVYLYKYVIDGVSTTTKVVKVK